MNEYEFDFQQPMPENEQPQSSGYVQPQTYPSYREASPKAPKKSGGKGIAAIALCCALLGGVLGTGGTLLAGHYLGSSQSAAAGKNVSTMVEGLRESSVIQTVQVDTGKQMTAAEVYAANVHSTVGITTSVTTNYFGFQTTSAASGSGFVITADGYILTNYHVVENSNSITVSMYDGTTYDAALIGYDESNDIAVLKIDADGLTPVILGDSDNLNVGDSVVAIGNPLGELTFSLTAGLVSAKDRQVTLSSNVTMNLLQTDCAINSGNSGGALFNLYGEVIGVTNAKYSSSSSSGASIDNIGFAIPINSIRSVVESIIEKGYISKPYMGVTVADVSTESQMYGLPQGAAIYSVVEGGPAEKAGLQTGDIVTGANGTDITCREDLVNVVSAMKVGDELTVTVYRQGEILDITVVIEEQIQSALANETQQSSQSGSPRGYGGRY